MGHLGRWLHHPGLELGGLILCASPVAGQWTQGAPGAAWIGGTFLVQRADTRFDEGGRRTVWLGNGSVDANVFVLDVVAGLSRKVDVWMQLQFLDVSFSRVNLPAIRSTGVGDLRVWMRYQVWTGPAGRWPVALRFGAKAPLGASAIDSEILPLGEGQWDLEGVLETGHVIGDNDVTVSLWGGYRLRFERTEILLDPGNEYFLLGTVAVPIGPAVFRAAFDGLWAHRLRAFDILTGSARRLLVVQGLATLPLRRSVSGRVGVRIPVAGRSFPADPQWLVGVATPFAIP